MEEPIAMASANNKKQDTMSKVVTYDKTEPKQSIEKAMFSDEKLKRVVGQNVRSNLSTPTNVALTLGHHKAQDMLHRNYFGQFSNSSFFTSRNNPNCKRCVHIKGLWGAPVCHVEDASHEFDTDAGFLPPSFPPNMFDTDKILQNSTNISNYLKHPVLPISCINLVNKQVHNPDMVRSLQHYTGLQNFTFKENTQTDMSKNASVPQWIRELKDITSQAIEPLKQKLNLVNPKNVPRSANNSSRGLVYSASSGRLIETPGTSSGFIKPIKCNQPRKSMAFLTQPMGPELEVFRMLCHILQTNEPESVKSWLAAASPLEKAYILDIISAALTYREDYYDYRGGSRENNNSGGILPPIQENKQLTKNEEDALMEEGSIIGGDGGGDHLVVNKDSPLLLVIDDSRPATQKSEGFRRRQNVKPATARISTHRTTPSRDQNCGMGFRRRQNVKPATARISTHRTTPSRDQNCGMAPRMSYSHELKKQQGGIPLPEIWNPENSVVM